MRTASKFYRYFNLTATLVFLTRKTFTDSEDYEIVKEGYNVGHGHHFISVFNISKDIGNC